MKRTLLYSVIALLATAMPIGTWGAEGYAALSNDNKTLTFYYDNEKSNRNGMDIGPFAKRTERGWDDNSSKITTVVFDNSFSNMKSLTSTAFWFRGCSNLVAINNIENLKTNLVTDMTSMFDGCKSLVNINLAHCNTENVETFTFMFTDCSSLADIDVSNFNTSKAKSFSAMFAGCEKLTNLDLSNFNTGNAVEMWSMFENCETLTELNISSFDTSNATNIRYMFADCYVIKTINLRNFNTSKVTNMKNMFMGNEKLTTIYVGNDWTTQNVEQGVDMFSGCQSLIGGEGTTWDENHTDYTYAHIDGGASNPGYLTYKENSGEPAGIGEFCETNEETDTQIYSLNGRKHSGNSPKGIYIKQGRKVLLK